jgi:hypothetical protein
MPHPNSLVLDKTYQVSRYYAGDAVTDAAWIAQLAKVLVENPEAELDPIDVFEIDGQLMVAHGFSRTAAYKLANRDGIPAIIHPGGHQEAMELALKANAKSQKATSLDDKWAHAFHALCFYGFEQSDKFLAKAVDFAFSDRFVSTVRDAHAALLSVWRTHGRGVAMPLVEQLCDGVPQHFIAIVRDHEWDNLPEVGQEQPADAEPKPQIRIAQRTLPNGKISVYSIDTTDIGKKKPRATAEL